MIISWTKRTVFLHVGTHKTGSTSIQRMLLEYHAPLLELGYHVRLEDHPNNEIEANSYQLANIFIRNSLCTPARVYGISVKKSLLSKITYLLQVNSYIRQVDVENIIISAEGFCFLRKPSELMFIKAFFFLCRVEVIPIIILREERDWRKSWKQEIKAILKRIPIDYSKDGHGIDGEWYFDKSAVIKFWSKVGKLRFADCVFDKGLDSVQLFLNLLDINLKTNSYLLNSSNRFEKNSEYAEDRSNYLLD